MCWTSRTFPVKKIAKKDIKVYKILQKRGSKICSPVYQDFIWKIGTDFYVPSHQIDPLNEGGLYSIHKGIHSLEDVPILRSPYWVTATGTILFGWENIDILFECIIPKGSVYYINSEGEIVSNCLRIVKEYKKRTSKWKHFLSMLRWVVSDQPLIDR